MAEAIRSRLPETAPRASEPALVGVMGVVMEAFPEGALWWEERRLLIVADLHLEKGSSFARRGQLIPPYDTTETLMRLTRLVTRLQPHGVVCLGDSFHDNDGHERLTVTARDGLKALQVGREWYWIAGNHDPDAPRSVGGMAVAGLGIGSLTFRHEPTVGPADGEIAGHLHPCARVYGRGRSVRRRCFAGDGYRMVLPAFGAYTGGLDVLDRAFSGLFVFASFRAFMMSEERIYPVGTRALRAQAE